MSPLNRVNDRYTIITNNFIISIISRLVIAQTSWPFCFRQDKIERFKWFREWGGEDPLRAQEGNTEQSKEGPKKRPEDEQSTHSALERRIFLALLLQSECNDRDLQGLPPPDQEKTSSRLSDVKVLWQIWHKVRSLCNTKIPSDCLLQCLVKYHEYVLKFFQKNHFSEQFCPRNICLLQWW